MAITFISQKIYGFNSVETKFIIPDVLVVIICNISPTSLKYHNKMSIHRRNKTKFFIFFSGFHSPDYPAPTISSYNEFASQQLRNVFYSEAASVVLYLIISFLQYINKYTLLQDVIIMRSPSIRLLSVRYAKNARPWLFCTQAISQSPVCSEQFWQIQDCLWTQSKLIYCVLQKQQVPQI